MYSGLVETRTAHGCCCTGPVRKKQQKKNKKNSQSRTRCRTNRINIKANLRLKQAKSLPRTFHVTAQLHMLGHSKNVSKIFGFRLSCVLPNQSQSKSGFSSPCSPRVLRSENIRERQRTSKNTRTLHQGLF